MVILPAWWIQISQIYPDISRLILILFIGFHIENITPADGYSASLVDPDITSDYMKLFDLSTQEINTKYLFYLRNFE